MRAHEQKAPRLAVGDDPLTPGDSPVGIPEDATPERVTEWIAERLREGASVSVATVVSRHGSSPSTPGQKLAMSSVGGRALSVGTVGGGAVELAVMRELARVLDARDAAAKVHTFRLGPSLGMCCGGAADVLVEAFAVARQVLVIGAGHVGLETARVLRGLAFDVALVDRREGAVEGPRVDAARSLGVRLVSADHDEPDVATLVARPPSSALVVATHDHQLDQAAIEWGLRAGFGFVGGVGSRRKALRTRERILARGLPAADAERVRMPIGLDIGARRPSEIAIAIAAELVAWRANARPRAQPTASRAELTKPDPEPNLERDLTS